MRKNAHTDGIKIKSSISYKIVAMFVVLTISVIIVIGTFMINRIDAFYHDEFKTLMKNVYNEEFCRQLAEKSGGENGVNQLTESVDAYSGQMGIDSFRNYYILDIKTGKALYGSNPELAKTLEITPNIISAMSGKTGDSTETNASYMDFAVPVGNYIVYIKDSKVEIDSVVRNILNIIFLSLSLGMFLSVVFGILLSRTIISPISSLTRKAQKITSGDFEFTIDVKSSDEIGLLTETFNDMAVELNDTLKQIQSEKDKVETILKHMADGVMAFDSSGKIIHINPAAKKLMRIHKIENMTFDDIFSDTEPKISQALISADMSTKERSIKRANVEIKLYFAKFRTKEKTGGIVVVLQDITEQQRLDNSRREFVANVSHELRTPLTTIKGYAETLLYSAEENDFDKDNFISFLNVINNESDRMTRLVKDLLVLSRLDYGKKGLKKEKFDLSALVESVVAKQEINAKSAHLTLTYEPLSALLPFEGDRDAMEQVLVNIISNAIKYTGSDGKIYVASGKMYDSVYIKIKDNGIGIPKEDLPHIFERFYRVDKARSREKGGTGLGLAISHDIIAAHGGSIKINSIYGAGTEVVIILPTGKSSKKTRK